AVDATAAKTFNVVAKSFEFDITPATFAVNQGDVVTINFSVPSNDQSQDGHGLLMETYVENAVSVTPGKSRIITFTATTVGHFQFACSVPSCGTGHNDMAGLFFVNPAVAQAPSISSINPSTGSTAGGTSVTISGANFQSGATVTIGVSAAMNVTVVDATTITALTPLGPASEEAAVKMDVVVKNPNNRSGTLASAFQYTQPPLNITLVTPSSALPA